MLPQPGALNLNRNAAIPPTNADINRNAAIPPTNAIQATRATAPAVNLVLPHNVNHSPELTEQQVVLETEAIMKIIRAALPASMHNHKFVSEVAGNVEGLMRAMMEVHCATQYRNPTLVSSVLSRKNKKSITSNIANARSKTTLEMREHLAHYLQVSSDIPFITLEANSPHTAWYAQLRVAVVNTEVVLAEREHRQPRAFETLHKRFAEELPLQMAVIKKGQDLNVTASDHAWFATVIKKFIKGERFEASGESLKVAYLKYRDRFETAAQAAQGAQAPQN